MSEELKIFLGLLEAAFPRSFFIRTFFSFPELSSIEILKWHYPHDRETNYGSVFSKVCEHLQAGSAALRSLIILLIPRGVGHDDRSCIISSDFSLAFHRRVLASGNFLRRFLQSLLRLPLARRTTFKGSLKSDETCVALERKTSI